MLKLMGKKYLQSYTQQLCLSKPMIHVSNVLAYSRGARWLDQCLTRDRGVAGLGFTGGAALCLRCIEQDTIFSA